MNCKDYTQLSIRGELEQIVYNYSANTESKKPIPIYRNATQEPKLFVFICFGSIQENMA